MQGAPASSSPSPSCRQRVRLGAAAQSWKGASVLGTKGDGIKALENELAGTIVTADDSNWDRARAVWNLISDQQPWAVVFVEGPEDVGSVVRFAGARGLKLLAQGTGHGAAPVGALDETIVIRTERMRTVEINREKQTARVEAGALALELAQAAHRDGLCPLPGSSPDVGIVGYTLGGGLSWLGRRYGFACNRVNAIELVTAGGGVKRVDAENDTDLFWALRGGGGGYAIVTALELTLLPIDEVYAGALVFPAELGFEAVRAYRDWAQTVPDEVTSVVRFLRPPPLPDVPEPIRDRPLLTIDAACIGGEQEGKALIRPLREIGEPIIDTFDQIPTPALSRIHMDPEQPVPALGHHALIRELPDAAIEAFVGAAGVESGSPLLLAELRQLGGALGRAEEGVGALAKLDARFVMLGIGAPMAPGSREAIGAHLDQLVEAMAPWSAPGGFYNFADRPCGVDAILPPETCARLTEVKRRWDPDGLFEANHSATPTAA